MGRAPERSQELTALSDALDILSMALLASVSQLHVALGNAVTVAQTDGADTMVPLALPSLPCADVSHHSRVTVKVLSSFASPDASLSRGIAHRQLIVHSSRNVRTSNYD